MLSERKLLQNKPFYAKNSKMAGKVNFLITYFKIVGIWIKMKIIKKKKSISVQRTQRITANIIMMFILGGHIKPISYSHLHKVNTIVIQVAHR